MGDGGEMKIQYNLGRKPCYFRTQTRHTAAVSRDRRSNITQTLKESNPGAFKTLVVKRRRERSSGFEV